MQQRKIMAAWLSLLSLAGCGSMQLDDFEETAPPLDLYEYFQGRIVAHGLFEDRFNDVRRRMLVTIDGRVTEDDVLVLDERFFYSDGETDTRVWRIERLGPGRYRGTADDVVGVAEGRAVGSALTWRYKLELPVGDDVWTVGFEDWLFLQPGDVLVNKAIVRRWGLEIGEVYLTMIKDTEGRAAKPDAWQR